MNISSVFMRAKQITIECLLGIVVACFPYGGNAEFSTTRHLPPSYDPNHPLSVTIEAHFGTNDCGGSVVDYVPIGWRVSNIWGPGGGLWNPATDRVVWGPVFGPLCGGLPDATLGYDLTPPPNATGLYSITGVISVDGLGVPTDGNSTLYPRPLLMSCNRFDTNTVLAFTTCSNVLYAVQRSPTIVPPRWVNIGTNLNGNGEIMQAIDASPGDAAGMFYRILLQATAATRLCPVRYLTNGPTPVRITMTLTPEVCQATVVETPPPGWQIENVSSGGSVVSTQIVWTLDGPSCGGSNLHTLTYSATAPVQETGAKDFAGQFSVNGVTNQILGDRQILPPFADVPNLAARLLPANYTPGTNLLVTVTISLSPTACGAAVAETPPTGWLISEVHGEGASASPNGNITWISSGPFCGGVSFYQFSYTVTPPISASGTAFFTGSFSVDDSSWLTDGDSSLPIGP